ncbi:MAG: 30S ribosomal protein S6 [Syntrophales bacterium]
MRKYETILIANADLRDDEQTALIARYSGIVTGQKGILIKGDCWGKRKLAYAIKKQTRGIYVLLEYAGEGSVVNELERNLKIDDKILKFMTILKEDGIDPVELEKELAELKQRKEDESKVTPPSGDEAPQPENDQPEKDAEIAETLPEDAATDAKEEN